MNRAFSLVEVIVVVMILSLVGGGIFTTARNSTQTIGVLRATSKVANIAPIVAFHATLQQSGLTKSAYDLLSKDYTITADRPALKRWLENTKINYKQSEYKHFTFGEQQNSENTMSKTETTDKENLNLFEISVIRKQLTHGNRSFSVYTMETK